MAPSDPQGRAIIRLLFVSWISVRVSFLIDLRVMGLFWMRFWIMLNIIMLWRSPRLTMMMVVLACVKA